METVEQRIGLLTAEDLKEALIYGIMELTQEERETLLEMWKGRYSNEARTI